MHAKLKLLVVLGQYLLHLTSLCHHVMLATCFCLQHLSKRASLESLSSVTARCSQPCRLLGHTDCAVCQSQPVTITVEKQAAVEKENWSGSQNKSAVLCDDITGHFVG